MKVILKIFDKEILLKSWTRRQVSLWLQPHANTNPKEGQHFYDDASRNKTRSHKGSSTQNHTSVDVKRTVFQCWTPTGCCYQPLSKIPSTIWVSETLARCSSPSAQHGCSGNLPLSQREPFSASCVPSSSLISSGLDYQWLALWTSTLDKSHRIYITFKRLSQVEQDSGDFL